MTTPTLKRNDDYLAVEQVLLQEAIPFKVSEGGKHPKVIFRSGGQEHTVTIPKSASDWRSPMNMRSTVKGILKQFPPKVAERAAPAVVKKTPASVIPTLPHTVQAALEPPKAEMPRFDGTMFAMVQLADLTKLVEGFQEVVAQLSLVREELRDLKDRPAMYVEPPKTEPEPLAVDELPDEVIDKVPLMLLMQVAGYSSKKFQKELKVSIGTVTNWRAGLKLSRETEGKKRLRAWKRKQIEKHPELVHTAH